LRQRKDTENLKDYTSAMMKPNSKTTVRELLETHPSTLAVFIERKMLCVGCPTEAFHTLEDVARIHSVELGLLLDSIRQTIQAKEKP
jgi:hybrid cluster-associated redox disulfide protein